MTEYNNQTPCNGCLRMDDTSEADPERGAEMSWTRIAIDMGTRWRLKGYQIKFINLLNTG